MQHLSRRDCDHSERFFQLRQKLEEIANEAVGGDLEDRRFLVLGDGDGVVIHNALDGDYDFDRQFLFWRLAGRYIRPRRAFGS